MNSLTMLATLHVPNPPITVLDGRPIEGMVIIDKVYIQWSNFAFGELIALDGYVLNTNGFSVSVEAGGFSRVSVANCGTDCFDEIKRVNDALMPGLGDKVVELVRSQCVPWDQAYEWKPYVEETK